MISVKALKEWIATLNDEDDIGIDEDGLQLHVVTAHSWAPYLEIGGMPDEVCDECGAAIFFDDPEGDKDGGAAQHKESCSMYEKGTA